MSFLPETQDETQEDIYGGRRKTPPWANPMLDAKGGMSTPDYGIVDRYESGKIGYDDTPKTNHSHEAQITPSALTTTPKTLPAAAGIDSSSAGGTTLGNESLGVKTDTPHLGRRDLSEDFAKLGPQPTRDQFKQPPLSGWRKLGIGLAGAAEELGDRMSHRPGGEGIDSIRRNLASPETVQTNKYGQAEKEWEGKLGALKTETELGELQARTNKLNEKPEDTKAPTLHDTDLGTAQYNPQTKTWDPMMVGGKPAGPKPPATEKPLSDQERTQINQQNETDWQTTHPGDKLHPEHTLQAGATSKDAERTTSAVRATMSSASSADQKKFQDNEATQRRKDSEDKENLTWVKGTDPKTKKSVAVPLSQAKKLGLENMGKVDANEQGMIDSARKFLPLSDRAMKSIDDLDKKGKLGVIASRWNDFKAGKVGNEPDFAPLRVLMGLDTTLLMKMHVGNRGATTLMQHFQGLADEGKMNAKTLKAALAEEVNYAKDVAQLPAEEGGAEEEPEYDINGKRVTKGAK